jgi:transposase
MRNPQRRPYPAEFRADAVRLARQPGHSIRSVAKDLDIATETLRVWCQQADIEAGRAEGLTGAEREELVRLRRRVRTLEEEREILVKAAAFFAQETGRTR